MCARWAPSICCGGVHTWARTPGDRVWAVTGCGHGGLNLNLGVDLASVLPQTALPFTKRQPVTWSQLLALWPGFLV